MSTLKVNQIEPRVGGDVSIGESGGTVTLATGATAVGFGDESPVKAWVNFNGTGTVAIRESMNVSSITDIGTGEYSVNFIKSMPDDNYSVSITLNHPVCMVSPLNTARGGPTTSKFDIYTLNASFVVQDAAYVLAHVIR